MTNRPVRGSGHEDNKTSYEEHRKIYEAIAQCDPERAMAIMDRHLARLYRAKMPEPVRLTLTEEST